MAASEELDRERSYLSMLYDTIDEHRTAAESVLADVLSDRSTGFAAVFERDRLSETVARRIHLLDVNPGGICFGKVVEADTHTNRYIGRIALEDDDHEPLLLDWRAPAAEAFYRATAVQPMGMVLRRHLITAGKTLIDIEDDLLSAESLSNEEKVMLVGEAALLLALERERTGQMGDIVATIQRDQDEIIRAPMRTPLIVTGGPGTGKTVVALHRAAYLLYTHRSQIDNNGVLIVGPSNLFLRYIERVLPSLGETSVALLDWSALLPGITGVPDPDPRAADLKGSLPMVEVLQRAVRLVERVPQHGVSLFGADGERVSVSADRMRRVRDAARESGLPHNQARRRFVKSMERMLRLHEAEERQYVERSRQSIRQAADRLWPVLRPQQLLDIVFGNERVLAAAAKGILSADEQRLLLRSAGDPWTVSDLPLLDELGTLLGPAPRARGDSAAVEHEAQRVAEHAYVEAMIEEYTQSDPEGSADLSLGAMVNTEQLVARFAEREPSMRLADRALRDPSWKFAHIVVDEAQDVSPMQWRALSRRCQQRSITIVGDPDQRSRPSTEPWIDRITRAFGIEQFEQRSLRVNYRTPAGLVGPAHQLRRHHVSSETTADTQAAETQYVRTGTLPWATRCASLDAAVVAAAVDRARQQLGDRGRLAVISSERDRALVAEVVQRQTNEESTAGSRRLVQPVAAYVASEVKGLEFDSVVLVDPKAILEEYGWRQLYVALTRPTRYLGVMLVGDLADYEAEWVDSGTVTG